MKTDRLESLQIGHSYTNLSFSISCTQKSKYLKINSKTVAHINIYRCIYTR